MQPDKPLSKNQQKFNRLVKKINDLEKQVTSSERELNETLDNYVKKIYPLQQSKVKLRAEFVRLMYPYYINKGISARDKDILQLILSNNLHEIYEFEHKLPDELLDIFEKVEGVSVEDARKAGIKASIFEMQEMMDNMGVDIEMEEPAEDLTEEQLVEKMNAFKQEIKRKMEEKEARKSTFKQSAKQKERADKQKEKEDIKKKSISSIYRQLAKILHPDLEQNPEIKLQKEVQMQKLTIAYEENDLHTLLKLELEWIAHESNNIDELSNAKLDIYNKLLSEQVRELEDQLIQIIHHPRFQTIHHYRLSSPARFMNFQGDLKAQVKDLKSRIAVLNSPAAEKEIKSMLKMARQHF